MKKTIFGLAMAAMMLVGAGANAQNTTSKVQARGMAQTAEVAKKCDKQKECKGTCEFEALNLSESQLIQLKDINIKYEAQKRDLFDNAKENAAKDRDSIKNVTRQQAKEMKRSKLKDIKAVLTTDQYVQFLENNYVNNPGPKGQMKKGPKQGMKDGKFQRCHDKDGKKGHFEGKCHNKIGEKGQKMEKSAKK